MLICKLLALNVNGLIGKPLTNNPSDDLRANNRILFLKSSETGVENNFIQNIKVYPNPITGTLNIDIDDTSDAMADIIVTGKQIGRAHV